MYCYNCGEDNPDEAKYCKNCGAILKKEETAKPVEVIETTNHQNNSQQRTTTTTTSSSSSSDSSWIACCCIGLVAIFILSALFSGF